MSGVIACSPTEMSGNKCDSVCIKIEEMSQVQISKNEELHVGSDAELARRLHAELNRSSLRRSSFTKDASTQRGEMPLKRKRVLGLPTMSIDKMAHTALQDARCSSQEEHVLRPTSPEVQEQPCSSEPANTSHKRSKACRCRPASPRKPTWTHRALTYDTPITPKTLLNLDAVAGGIRAFTSLRACSWQTTSTSLNTSLPCLSYSPLNCCRQQTRAGCLTDSGQAFCVEDFHWKQDEQDRLNVISTTDDQTRMFSTVMSMPNAPGLSLMGEILLEIDLRKAASISQPDAPQLCSILHWLLEWEGKWGQLERDLAVSIGRPDGRHRVMLRAAVESCNREDCTAMLFDILGIRSMRTPQVRSLYPKEDVISVAKLEGTLRCAARLAAPLLSQSPFPAVDQWMCIWGNKLDCLELQMGSDVHVGCGRHRRMFLEACKGAGDGLACETLLRGILGIHIAPTGL